MGERREAPERFRFRFRFRPIVISQDRFSCDRSFVL